MEIRSRRMSNQVFAGEFHSAFKGRGMSFKEVREYSPGDDIRFIDWNVSARFGHPFSKVFEEEKSLTVMLLLDVSASNELGSRHQTKRHLMTELAAVLAFSAIANNNKVGGLFFSNKVEKIIPPAKGRHHVLYLLRQLLAHQSDARNTQIGPALKMLRNTMKQTTLSFLMSDFYAPQCSQALKTAAIRHDGVAIHLTDSQEMALPTDTLLPLQDAETGQLHWLDTHGRGFNQAWHRQFEQNNEAVRQQITGSGWDYLRFNTGADYVPTLQQFFLNRIKRP